MSTHLLGSTVLMGLVFGAIFYSLSRIGVSRAEGSTEDGAIQPYAGTSPGAVASSAESPGRLGAVFLAVTLVLGGLSVAAVGGMGTSENLVPGLFAAIVGLFGVLLVGFLFAGTYVMSRQHGLGRAHGIAAGLFLVGIVGVLLIAANLAFQFVG